jgi:DNA repair protein RecN (Recombination protein N)
MLTHLRITDFALLDDVEISLGPGLNVLSGETGTGKSLLLDAVALLRGGRASAEVVRTGAEEARIEAIFEPPHGPAADALKIRLAQAGIDPVEEGLVVRRIVGKSGRGRVYINNALSTAAALSSICGVLIELAGQHEHQTLTDPARHLEILDAFGTADDLSSEMATAYAALVEADDALQAASLDDRARADQEELVRFLLRELDEAGLEAGENARLKVERDRLRSVERLSAVVGRGEEILYAGEGAVVEVLGQLGHDLAELAKIDPDLARMERQLEEARVLCEDVAGELRRYGDLLEADPRRLTEVEERLDLLGRLLRKHRADANDVDALIAKREALRSSLLSVVSYEERHAELEAAALKAHTRAVSAAEAISSARAQAAETLSERVAAELGALGMAGARLQAVLSPIAPQKGDRSALLAAGRRISSSGWDRVEFLLQANRGEEPRPLSRIASGGELSRIMLAFKKVLSRADRVATYVFDEVDTGIGGAVADVVGRQIHAVAQEKQVLCITHLPQIAAYADLQFLVEKQETDGRVRTVVRRLKESDRREEIARMLGGKLTPKARAHAEELLRSAAASRGRTRTE